MPLGAFRADTLPPVAQGGADPAFAVAAGDVVGVYAGAFDGVPLKAFAQGVGVGFEPIVNAAGEGGAVRLAGEFVGHLRPLVALWLAVYAAFLETAHLGQPAACWGCYGVDGGGDTLAHLLPIAALVQAQRRRPCGRAARRGGGLGGGDGFETIHEQEMRVGVPALVRGMAAIPKASLSAVKSARMAAHMVRCSSIVASRGRETMSLSARRTP